LRKSYPGTLEAAAAGCLYYYGIGQSTDALPYCAQQTDISPNNHTAFSNYGWAALDANQFTLALQEFSKAYKIVSPDVNQLDEYQAVDLFWGFTIAEYSLGNKKEARRFVRTIRKNYPAAATVTGLQQMPLLWSATTMQRIEGILEEFPK
jgi:tetratricopeptide (TPR) repeat protein